MLQFCSLKKLKAYIGPLIVFSCMLQSAAPLIAISRKSESSKKISSQIQSSTSSVVDSNLDKLIRHMVEEANGNTFKNNISDALKKCYRNLSQDRPVHSIEDVWQAMPEILQYAVEYHTRASRPNDPITSSSAIVGPGGCDLTRILGLLVAIKNRIGCVDDPVCCNTILGILGNACEIFGPNSSISSILLEILNEINGTQTIICTITGLEALSEQLAECCENLSELVVEEHMETRTIIIDALEECCENIRNDIFDTQTQLAECCEEILTNVRGACTATSLGQSDFAFSTFIIDTPGRYIFAEDVTFSPIFGDQPAIEIRSDDVILDLCGKTLRQGNSVSGIDGIRIQGGTSGSPRSNVEVRNGTVSDFTRAGITVGTNSIIPANTACIRIRLQDLDVVACQIRGIELLGTASAQITESELDGCNIINCCKVPSADFALQILQCSSVSIRQSSLYNNGISTIVNFSAVNIQNCLTCFLNNITVDFNTGQNFIGFNLNACENCTFTNCIVSKCTAPGALRGFEFIAGATNTKNIMRFCQVLDNTANNGPFIGFDLLVGVIFNQLVECLVANNSTINALATANCIGFNYDRVERCSTVQCRALRNLALADGTTNIAVGYNIISTGGAATGNVACEWVRCDAVGNTAFTAARSFGFRATSTANGNRVNAYLGNVAYRNGPTGTAISTRQITADGGMDSFVGGVPFNSVRTVNSLNNFNGVNDQYSNIRIAD